MTSILTRYILRQHIGPFLFGFSIIAFIWILNLLFKELNRILSKGLPLLDVLEFFALNLAWIVALTVPMAVLVASLMAYGRLSADNEITAIKSSGVSFMKILTPTVIAAVLVALFLVWFNNTVLPEFNHRLANLMRDISRKKPTFAIDPGVWYEGLAPYYLLVGAIKDSGGVSYVTNVLVQDFEDRDEFNTITAQRGKIRLEKETGLLEMTLYDGEIQKMSFDKLSEFHHVAFQDSHILRMDVSDQFLVRTDQNMRSDREKSAQQMRDEVASYRDRNTRRREAVSLVIAQQFQKYFGDSFGLKLPGDADSLAIREMNPIFRNRFSGGTNLLSNRTPVAGKSATNGVRKKLMTPEMALTQAVSEQKSVLNDTRSKNRQINANLTRINRNLVEIYKKYSIPFACVVFVLVGAPLGIKARTGSLGAGAGMSLVFFLIFWTSLIGGEDLADRGIIPPWLAMWGANIIVGAGGLYILYLTVKEKESRLVTGVTAFVTALRSRDLRLFQFLSRRSES